MAVLVFLAIAEWRLGLLLCLVMAILQDPLEKAYAGSTRLLCCVCWSGVCWHVPWGSRSGSSVKPEHDI